MFQVMALLDGGMNLSPSPQFRGTQISQSLPELGDLGGEETCNSDIHTLIQQRPGYYCSIF
jgi:hypothetical protein